MIKCLINLLTILVIYFSQNVSLKAGCEDDYYATYNKRGEYICVDSLTPKERAQKTKRDRYDYLTSKYTEEVRKFEASEPDKETQNVIPASNDKEFLFSNYQGKKTWQEAKEHCNGLGMRLPTEKEIAYAFQSGLTKKWNGGVGAVWTDKENSSLNLKYTPLNYTKESMLGFSCLDSSFSLTESQEKDLPLAYLFSEYQGNMNWYSANAKCSSIGMRLPTIRELKAAYNAGITKSWQKNDRHYWSSTPYGSESYYSLRVLDGYTDYYDRSSRDNVRCRRQSPPSVSHRT